MRRLKGVSRWPFVLAAALALGVALGDAPQAGATDGSKAAAPYNVLLIGWDGVQRDHMKECLSRSELPNLAKLAEEGALMAIDVSTGATDTKAGWAQILTGYDPERTGVHSNGKYQPIPEGASILERVENRFGPDNVATVFLAGKKNHVGARGPHIVKPKKRAKKGAQPAEADFEQHEIIEIQPAKGKAGAKGGARNKAAAADQAKAGAKAKARTGGKRAGKGAAQDVAQPEGRKMAGEPHFHAKAKVDQFENGLGAPDNVGAKALAALDKYKDQRFFFFVHFQEPDHLGHKNGENSQQYTDGIVMDDVWLGKLVAKLKELDLYEKTRIYVACDHGFDEGKSSHKKAPYVFFATNDPLVGNAGDRKDVAPTILWRLGFDLDKIEPPLDGKPLKRSEAQEPIW